MRKACSGGHHRHELGTAIFTLPDDFALLGEQIRPRGIFGNTLLRAARPVVVKNRRAELPKGSRAIVSVCAGGGLGTAAVLEN
jgi:hypothetical protein